MNIRAKTALLLLAAAALLLPTSSASARGVLDTKVIFGEDFTLAAGETLDGDLIVLGGDLVIEAGAVVTRSVVVIGGQLRQAGNVGQDIVVVGGQVDLPGRLAHDVVVVGGQLNLPSTARVQGDVVIVGGQVEKDPSAVVEGNVVESLPDTAVDDRQRVTRPEDFGPPSSWRPLGPAWGAASLTLRALAMAALATLLALFLGPQMDRTGSETVARAGAALGLGLLTALLLPVAVLLLGITIVLIPVALLVLLAFFLAGLFGTLALGTEVGQRLGSGLKQPWTLPVSAGLGTFLLVLVTGAAGAIPCAGFVITVLVGLLAVGGTLLGWLGGARRATITDPTEHVDLKS